MAPNQLGDHFYITIISGKVVFTLKKKASKTDTTKCLASSWYFPWLYGYLIHFLLPFSGPQPGGRIDALLFILISLETEVLVAAHADAQLRLETATCFAKSSPKERWDSPIIYTSYDITLQKSMYVYSYYKNQHIYIYYSVSYELHYFSSVAMLIVVSSL
jgi:hypothetical protein